MYIIFLFLIRQSIKDKISKRLAFVYISYWCLSLFLCKTNPFGYYKVADDTYILLILHLVSFFIGFILYRPRFRREVYSNKLPIAVKLIKNRLFIVSYLICLGFVLVLFYRQRMLIELYTLGEMRGDFMDLILEGSGGAYLFYHLPANIMYHIITCFLTYMILFERNYKCMFFLSPYAIMWTLLGGGRAQVMNYGFYLISMWMIADYLQSVKDGYKSKYRFSLKGKILLVIFGAGLVLSMSMVSFMKRSTGKIDSDAIKMGFEKLMMDFGEYSAGPIVAFDIGRNDKEIMSKEYQYGAGTFSGLDYFLFISFRKFGIHEKTSYYLTTSLLQNKHRNIAPDRGWNYAYTSCMYYYYDFGAYGVLFIPLILGYLTRKLISRLYLEVNLYNIAIFTFICFCIYWSVFSGYLHKMVTPFYLMVLIFIPKLCKGEKRVNNNLVMK